jgi:hypothetical protein
MIDQTNTPFIFLLYNISKIENSIEGSAINNHIVGETSFLLNGIKNKSLKRSAQQRNSTGKTCYRINLYLIIFLLISFCSCTKKEDSKPAIFEALTSDKTGLDFINKLAPTPAFNMFKYLYYYNGAGVGAGDFNNDGLIDLFFSANQGTNKLFINTGGLKFKDISADAKIPQDGGWSTGVSVVDINNDGLLDIYVCKVGQYEILKGKNQLLVCDKIDKNGMPVYSDKAKDYGLDFSGFSTQSAFFDYDQDGDLDMYLMNHSVHHDGHFQERKSFTNTHDPLSGDCLYRNDGNKFVDVTKQTGINSSAIGYGLGLAVADINVDGYPDIYVGNDFHENDYLYFNQKNGTFKDELSEHIMHTSQFSMGVDVADINNDAFPEIISLDMLPADPYVLKRSLGDNEYNIFNLKIGYGYSYQYSRNALQLNRINGSFSECGMFSGVYATDWSWAPLWMDFDNDGLKDLFISNGIPKRLNDMDYVNFISNAEVQEKIRTNRMEEKDMALIDKFPEIKLENKFFKNFGELIFKDQAELIHGDIPTYSNGAVYADFDNDGDLDIVVNNIDDPVLLYQNKANSKSSEFFVQIKVKGPPSNINAVGTKVIVYADSGIRTYEKFPVKGFQSSMEIPIHIGLYKTKVDSMFLIWPDNSYQRIEIEGKQHISISYKMNLQKFDYANLTRAGKNSLTPFVDITKEVNLQFRHKENPFVEFDREPLIPHMVSREGPALAIADVNRDGLDDIFIGGSRGYKNAVFLQQRTGHFKKSIQPQLDIDSTYEDIDASWVDVNNDKHIDLVIASGGNEYYGYDEHLRPRVYLNDGKAQFTGSNHAFDSLYLTASCIIPYDFTRDGYVDLFVGGRAVPWDYGKMPSSYLLENDKTGKFKDVTNTYSSELSKVGFVTNAIWFDLDSDGDQDIILSLEWDGICAFVNDKGRFTKKLLTKKKGWWNFTLPCDVDNDGDIDFVVGNLGLNNRFNASENAPVRMYYNDFDGNGRNEQLLTYYLQGREIPFANKDELQKQIPGIRSRFLYAGNFARASLQDIFTKEKLKKADTLIANYFSNAILINQGNLNFVVKPLPSEAQLSPYKDAVVINANNDDLPDILLLGNQYNANIQMGRYDADFGTILVNKGKGSFACGNINGLNIKGEVRNIGKITIGKQMAFVIARNNDSVMVIKQK